MDGDPNDSTVTTSFAIRPDSPIHNLVTEAGFD